MRMCKAVLEPLTNLCGMKVLLALFLKLFHHEETEGTGTAAVPLSCVFQAWRKRTAAPLGELSLSCAKSPQTTLLFYDNTFTNGLIRFLSVFGTDFLRFLAASCNGIRLDDKEGSGILANSKINSHLILVFKYLMPLYIVNVQQWHERSR